MNIADLQLVAHRGNAREFPENTLPALDSAIGLGARYIEFDVQLTADQTPVLLHDEDLLRTSGIAGSIFEVSSTDLASVYVGEPERFGERFRSVRIPLLRDVVDLLHHHAEVSAFVEIKKESLRRFGDELTVERVLQVLRPVRERCIVISFQLSAVYLALRNGFKGGWVLSAFDEHSRLKCETLKPQFVFCNHRRLPVEAPSLWRGPWSWVLYEIDTPQLAMAAAKAGARFIETMAVAQMLEFIRGAPRSAG